MLVQDYVKPSTRMNKKYMVRVDGRLIHFGQRGASDYTIHHDKHRRELYHIRHAKDHIFDYYTAGFWSKWLLWTFTDMQRAFDYIMEHFDPPIERL